MVSVKKIVLFLAVIGFATGITTCSVHREMPVHSQIDPAETIYPSLTVPLPSCSLLAEFPSYKPELYKTDRKPVTTRFNSFQTKHVRATDPLLFASGNTFIIDFKDIEVDAYAFPLPGGKVISNYGGRRRGHSGVDIKTCANDTIVAAFSGIVRMSSPYAAYGKVVVIRHYNGLETLYSHNSKNLVNVGDTVHSGQPIALTGRTGRATTEHLHFEVRINGEHVNPGIFYDFNKRELRKQSYACTRNGQKVAVTAVDPFPFQEQYLSSYL